ncbi:MAG: tetratricopeptide repeat protein [bacterium]
MAINKNKVIAAAQKYVQKGQLDKAIKEYCRVVEAEPGDVRTWLKIGDLQAKSGAAEQAVDTYLRVANHYSEQGFYLKAVAVYKQVILLQPRFVQVHLQLASLYKQLGLLTDARRQLEAAFQVLHEEGRVEDSMEVLRAMTEIDPDNVAVRIRLAETLSKEKKISDAVVEFTRAADILRSSGRMDDFIRVAERLIWHKADNVLLTKELATLYLRRNDPRRALQKLQVCYKADEKDTETLNLLVNAFLDLDQKTKAVTILKVLANVHEEKGEPEHRDDVYRRILGLDSGDEDAIKALRPAAAAKAVKPKPAAKKEQEAREPDGLDELEELDEPEELDEFEELDSLDEFEDLDEPDSPANQIATLYGEAEVYEKFGLLKEAVEQLEQAKQLDPDNIDTQVRLKELYVKLGNVDDAVNSILIVAGQKLDAQPGEARALLAEALELDPGNRRVQEMLDSVADEEGLEPPVWDRIESDARILDDIAAEAFAEDPEYATSEIDIEALEQELEGRSITGSGFRAVVTAEEDLSQDALSELASLGEDSGELDLAQVGLEYLEQDFHAEALGDQDDDLLFDPLADDDELVVQPGRSPSGAPLEDDFEVDLGRIRAGLDDAGGQGREPWEADDLSLDLEVSLEEEAEDTGDTAVVSRADLERIVEGPDEEELLLDRVLEEGADEDLFQDELSQLQETAELVASLRGANGGSASALPKTVRDESGELDLDSAFSELEGGAAGDDAGVADRTSAELTEEVVEDEPTGFVPAVTEEGDPAFADVDVEALEEEMEDTAFFVDQGLYEEAIGLLRDLIEEHGEHPRLMAKIESIKGMMREEGEADLSVALGQDVIQEERTGRLNIPRKEADAFHQFKEGVAKQVGEDDAETHFDVGIAYKEMGMFTDAIGEFRAAMRPHNEVQCHVMIALCHREQQDLTEAINEYKKALYCEQITDHEQVDLYFQMGVAYEDLKDPREAMYYYDKVVHRVAGYRDVDDRLANLKAALDPTKSPSQNDVDSAFDELLGMDNDKKKKN